MSFAESNPFHMRIVSLAQFTTTCHFELLIVDNLSVVLLTYNCKYYLREFMKVIAWRGAKTSYDKR